MADRRLRAEERRVGSLEEPLVESMWRLFERYYADVDRAAFVRDLADKDDVLLLVDRARGTLAGFSTIRTYVREVGGRRVVVLFSGDTICDEQYWGQRTLHTAFLRYVLRRKLRNPLVPVYWFLISKGYKTYLLLAKNFPEHWPRHDRATPPWQGALLDTLAREKYGDAWLPERGVLRFSTPQGRLRGGVAPVGAAERADPYIRFFDDRNPDAPRGDELCCLGRIDAALVLNYAARRLRRIARGRARAARPIAVADGAAR